MIHKLTQRNGLTTDQVKNIVVENPNVFWASTNSGLSRIEIKKLF
ncbi:hypothetical protein [Chryseobacterium wanjuense]